MQTSTATSPTAPGRLSGLGEPVADKQPISTGDQKKSFLNIHSNTHAGAHEAVNCLARAQDRGTTSPTSRHARCAGL